MTTKNLMCALIKASSASVDAVATGSLCSAPSECMQLVRLNSAEHETEPGPSSATGRPAFELLEKSSCLVIARAKCARAVASSRFPSTELLRA